MTTVAGAEPANFSVGLDSPEATGASADRTPTHNHNSATIHLGVFLIITFLKMIIQHSTETSAGRQFLAALVWEGESGRDNHVSPQAQQGFMDAVGHFERKGIFAQRIG